MNPTTLPVAVIGAGPVGLAAAAHLSERGIPFVVFELGDDIAASIREWLTCSCSRHGATTSTLQHGGCWRPTDGPHPTAMITPPAAS